MGLPQAITAMRNGYPVARRVWAPSENRDGRWFVAYVILMVPASYLARLRSLGSWDEALLWQQKEAVLFQVTNGGHRIPWTPDASDVLADDWYIYEGDPAPTYPVEEPESAKTPQQGE